jgi:glycosyltransferase involved in cell wall biosynthesis
MKVLVLLDGNNGVAFHRLYTPFARLQMENKLEVDVCLDPNEYGNLDYTLYDAVICNRWMGKLQYNILPILEKNNIPLILDVDDYWVLPKHNPAYKFYRAYLKNACKDAMAFASAVMVTTPQLAKKVAEINPNVYIVPNALDLNQQQWNETIEHPLTIGWVGGISHVEDIKLLRDQIEPIIKKHNARFLMCGYHEGNKMWMDMEQAITGKRRYQRPEWFETRTGTSADKYGAYYSEIDVVLAPLTGEHFNRYKSELKIIEASAYSLPIVCSAVEPYTNHLNNFGALFAYKNDWSVIEQAIAERDERGQKNGEYCNKNHNLQRINETRLEVIKSVIKF